MEPGKMKAVLLIVAGVLRFRFISARGTRWLAEGAMLGLPAAAWREYQSTEECRQPR